MFVPFNEEDHRSSRERFQETLQTDGFMEKRRVFAEGVHHSVYCSDSLHVLTQPMKHNP